jgi:hypothetical protein
VSDAYAGPLSDFTYEDERHREVVGYKIAVLSRAIASPTHSFDTDDLNVIADKLGLSETDGEKLASHASANFGNFSANSWNVSGGGGRRDMGPPGSAARATYPL